MRFGGLIIFLSMALAACGGGADEGETTDAASADESGKAGERIADEAAAEDGAESPFATKPDEFTRKLAPAFAQAVDEDILGITLGQSPNDVVAILEERGFSVDNLQRRFRGIGYGLSRLRTIRKGNATEPTEEIDVVFSPGGNPQVIAVSRETKPGFEQTLLLSNVLASLEGKYGDHDNFAAAGYGGPNYYFAGRGTTDNCEGFQQQIFDFTRDGEKAAEYDGCVRGLAVLASSDDAQGRRVISRVAYLLTDANLFPPMRQALKDFSDAERLKREQAREKEMQERIEKSGDLEL